MKCYSFALLTTGYKNNTILSQVIEIDNVRRFPDQMKLCSRTKITELNEIIYFEQIHNTLRAELEKD